MRIGFIVPTDLESQRLPVENQHICCAGYGSGKASACAAAAKLVFSKHCDTILLWGLAGGISPKVDINDIVVGSRVAYRDFNIAPLCNSTGVGFVPVFAENIFVELDAELRGMLVQELQKLFPDRQVKEGAVCTGDQFVEHHPGDEWNRVEAVSDVVDMESAAVVHFCHKIDPHIRVGIIRVVSDHADHHAGGDFSAFLQSFAEMNTQLYKLRENLLARCHTDIEQVTGAIQNFADFPAPGVQFKDIWGIISNHEIFATACHLMYDAFFRENPDVRITKVAGVESRGFIFGYALAKMLDVPFVPLRKKGKLPGEVVSDTYLTEYSENCLEGQKTAFNAADRVLLIDDIIATGGSLLAARNIIIKCGAECSHCLALGQINGLSGAELLEQQGISATYLLKM